MSKTLLVVDDALIIREIIKEAAEEGGWEIAGEATNGQEGIEQYDSLRPDAVTLDMVMPEFDGLHALEGILNSDPAAKVLVVSAIEQTSILKDALNHGASDYIVKPFDAEHVIDALDKLVVAD